MSRRLLISLIFGFLAAVPALAAPAPKQWMVQYKGEDGRLIVDKFRRAQDGWQDKIETRSFANASEFLEFVENNTKVFLVTADPEFQDLVDLRPETRESPSEDGAESVFFGDGQELTGPGKAAQGLWEARNKWDASWEQKFSTWISTDIDAQFFQKYKLATDCADVLYALRWIFARNNQLEMASRLSGSGSFVTHRSLRGSWASLPTAADWFADRRFMAALNYILDNTYTHSLMTDSYPIEIKPGAVAPGVYHLDLHRESGHTQIIYRTDQQPGILLPFLIIQSTVPRKVRELSVQGFWYTAQPLVNKGGLLRMRWPEFKGSSVTLTNGSSMPSFSNEQYAADFLRKANFPYNQEVYLRLNPTLDFKKVAEEAYQSMQTMFKDRLQIVEDGFVYCSKNSCAPGSSGYEDWSTPTRDKRIADLNQQVRLILQNLPTGAFDRSPLLHDDFIEIQGQSYNLALLLAAWQAGSFSSEPMDLPAKRWGVSGEAIADWASVLLQKAGAEREQALKAGQVPAEQDQKMSTVPALMSAYQKDGPSAQLALMTAAMSVKALKLGGETLSLAQWVRRLPWFVSDGQAPVAQQWGAHGANYDWLRVDNFVSTTFSQGGWMLGQRLADWTLEKRALGGGQPVKTGTGLAGLIEDDDTLVQIDGDRVLLTDLETNHTLDETLGFTPNQLKMLRRGFLVSNLATGEFALGQVGENGFAWLEKGKAAWWPRDVVNLGSAPANVLMFGLTAPAGKARVWDLSEAGPKSFEISAASNMSAKINTEKWVGLSGAGFLVKATGTVLPNLDVARLYQCHASGESCLLVNASAGIQYEFMQVEDDGHMTLQKIFKGMIVTGEDSIVVNENGQNPRAYRWLSRSLTEIAPQSDEKFIWQVNGEHIFAITNGDKARLRDKTRTVFEGNGYIREAGEGYFEYFDEASGLRYLRSFAGGAVLSATKVDNSVLSSATIRVPFGSLTSDRIWLK